ncbi:hypothetical protein J9Z47_005072 [Salmonella enterica]|nr:hypothetical protein [Salmonella enterica]
MRALTNNEIFSVYGADRGDSAVAGAVAGGTAGGAAGGWAGAELGAELGSLAGPIGTVVGFFGDAALGAFGGAYIYDSFSSPSNGS